MARRERKRTATQPPTVTVAIRIERRLLPGIDKRARALKMTRSKYLACLAEFSLESPAMRVSEVLARWMAEAAGVFEESDRQHATFGDLEVSS
jgi:hypothetical protein